MNCPYALATAGLWMVKNGLHDGDVEGNRQIGENARRGESVIPGDHPGQVATINDVFTTVMRASGISINKFGEDQTGRSSYGLDSMMLV